MDGMPRHFARSSALGEGTFEYLNMHFAESLHFLDWHAAVDERLFHRRHLRRAHSLDQLREFFLHFADGAAFVEPADYFLEFYLSFRIDCRVFAHGSSLYESSIVREGRGWL